MFESKSFAFIQLGEKMTRVMGLSGQKVRLCRNSPLLCGGLDSPSLSQSHRANHLPQIVHGQPKGGPSAVDAMRQREMFSGAEAIFQMHARVAHVEQNIVVSL
jgi:hypothetical protein